MGAAGRDTEGNRGKLVNLVRYIFEKCPEGMEFSKLSNMVYLVECEAYPVLGRTITGRRAIHRPWGVEIEGLRRTLAYLRRRGELQWSPRP